MATKAKHVGWIVAAWLLTIWASFAWMYVSGDFGLFLPWLAYYLVSGVTYNYIFNQYLVRGRDDVMWGWGSTLLLSWGWLLWAIIDLQDGFTFQFPRQNCTSS